MTRAMSCSDLAHAREIPGSRSSRRAPRDMSRPRFACRCGVPPERDPKTRNVPSVLCDNRPTASPLLEQEQLVRQRSASDSSHSRRMNSIWPASATVVPRWRTRGCSARRRMTSDKAPDPPSPAERPGRRRSALVGSQKIRPLVRSHGASRGRVTVLLGESNPQLAGSVR